jgi:hypothetical protein
MFHIMYILAQSAGRESEFLGPSPGLSRELKMGNRELKAVVFATALDRFTHGW